MNLVKEENLTNSKLESKLQISCNDINELNLNKSQTILLFSLYDNRLIHEKFLEQLFENLIENRQLIKYDFQKKIYSIYPNNSYFNFKILNKFKILASLSLLCLLLRYIRYRKLISDNFVFLQMYLKTSSQIFNSKLSIILLILRKRYRYSKIKLYKICKTLKYIVFNLYKVLVFNYLHCKFLLDVSISSKSYKKFYQFKN